MPWLGSLRGRPSALRGAAVLAGAACMLIVACTDAEDRSGDPAATPAPTLSATLVPSSAILPVEGRASPTPTPPRPPVATPQAASASSAAIPTPPDRDLNDLARRFLLGGRSPTPLPSVLANPDQVGQRKTFWLVDLAAPLAYPVEATLLLVTPQAAWYVQDGVGLPEDTLRVVADGFEAVVYPGVVERFAGDATRQALPPQVSILVARLRGAAGYFGGIDLHSTEVFRHSNERPMLYVEAGVIASGERPALGLLAHELQHLVHWYADPTEDTWVNEGLSEVAAEVLGLGRRTPAAPSASASLTRWSELTAGSGRSYDASHLFFRYLLKRDGGAAAPALLMEGPDDGIAGIDAYLRRVGAGVTFEEVFRDWTVANLLGPEGPAPFGYNEPDRGLVAAAPRHSLAFGGAVTGAVGPFATDYVSLTLPPGPAVIRFSGDAEVRVLPTDPPSGERCWWGNRGDSIDSRLTRRIDLRGLDAATLRFSAWYDIERSWDFAYVVASTDDGETWDVLPGTSSTTEDALGVSYGPGYTGASGGWLREEVDLSDYAGGEVLVGFEYVTDDAFNGDGICLDDIEIPEASFFDDAESDAGWLAEGFARIDNTLAQRFSVRVVTVAGDGEVAVTDIAVGEDGQGLFRFGEAGPPPKSATVIVSSVTTHAGERASYKLSLDEEEDDPCQ